MVGITKYELMTIFDINRNYVNDLISARDFKQFMLYRSNQVYYDPSKEFFEMFKTVLNEKYKTKKTDMTYDEFLKKLSYCGDVQLYIKGFTQDMNMCYNRKCQCKGCFFEKFFTPYDIKYPTIDQSLLRCRYKQLVREAIRRGYKPNEKVVNK